VNFQLFENPSWYRATTLTELAATLTEKQHHRCIDTNLAKQKLEYWRQKSPFNSHTFFTERLEMDNITEAQLTSLLGESIESTKERFSETPDWLQQITQAFNHTATSHSQPFWLSQLIQSTVNDSFVSLVEPLIHQGCQRVLNGMESLEQDQADSPFNTQETIKLLLPILTLQLATIMARTLALELNILRLQELLDGDTPETRFQSFIVRLRQPEIALELLQEYPVLARQITLFITHWVTFSLEFLQHLCADWDAIKATFSPDQHPGILTDVQGQAGDRHQQGRSVCIATFSSGLQLVYKPRSLAVDTHFQLLLSWLNERSDGLSFRTLKVLNREHYGWMEFVQAES
jgi:lantibiotic modifying enzyme